MSAPGGQGHRDFHCGRCGTLLDGGTDEPVAARDLRGEVHRLREQIAWTVARCNAAMGDGFEGTPNSAVAAVCDELERLRAESVSLDAVVEALRERGELACGGFEKEAAEFLLQEFRDGNAA